MEFRWLSTEERQTRAVESQSASEILALAQKLQAQNEDLVTEQQLIETGRELGIRPEYVREALRLQTRSAPPRPVVGGETETLSAPSGGALVGNVTRSLMLIFALGMFPPAVETLSQSGVPMVPFFAVLAAAIAGWSAQYPNLARIAGAMAVPVVLFVAPFFPGLHQAYRFPEAVVLSLLSLCPICAVAGSTSARFRGWLERLGGRSRLSAPGH